MGCCRLGEVARIVGSLQECSRRIRMGYRQWVEVGPIEVYAVKQYRLTPEDYIISSEDRMREITYLDLFLLSGLDV
jgi:hypothetical protein